MAEESYILLLAELEKILGKGKPKSKDNYGFACPFCNHRKKDKLEIKMTTNDNGFNPWECWVCQTKGLSIDSLLRRLGVPVDKREVIQQYIPKRGIKAELSEDGNYNKKVTLPQSFVKLVDVDLTDLEYKRAVLYLKSRGITYNDLIKYEIGYCKKGDFKDRLIFPSYKENGELNFFVSRKIGDKGYYRKPDLSNNIIFYESFINWNVPIILCEGTFDAISIKRNAIPLLGKTMSKELQLALIERANASIYIALDNDALKQAIETVEKLIKLGIQQKIYLVEMPESKDPSNLKFEGFTKLVSNSEPLTLEKIFELKMSL